MKQVVNEKGIKSITEAKYSLSSKESCIDINKSPEKIYNIPEKYFILSE
jgi:hypothetical protein